MAAKIGLPAEQVFKTLVARGERNGVVMAVIPGDQELILRHWLRSRANAKFSLYP